MILTLSDILPPQAIAAHHSALAEDPFEPGAATAGWHAKGVKHNEQSQGPAAQAVINAVRKALMANTVFMAAARPKAFVRVLASRYRPGMSYGRHVDDALMGGLRTDLSFTMFLSDPDSYDGGELVIEGHGGDSAIKLPAGGLVLYPTTSLHRVAEVTRGERVAVIGWVRSFVRNSEQRETLFDLDQLVATLRAQQADRPLMDQLAKVRNTLTRMWAED